MFSIAQEQRQKTYPLFMYEGLSSFHFVLQRQRE